MAYYSCNVDINDMFANIEQNSIMMSCFVAKLICDTFLCNMYVYLLRVFDKIFIVLLNEMYLNTTKDEMDITRMRINSQSLEDTQVGYISQKYTLDKHTLEKIYLKNT